MLASTEALDALKSIGLNLYERKIFVALLTKGIATAAEVSEIAGVPRSRSYDILESLAEKGFVVQQPSKPIKYVALEPKEALERTKENLVRTHNEMIERIDKLKVAPVLNELNSIFKQSLNIVKPASMAGTLKGRFMIDRQLRSVMRDAKSHVNIMTTSNGLTDLYTNHFRTLKKLSKRGVKVRIFAPVNKNKLSKEFSEIAELRNVDSPLGRICTVDGEHVIMALTEDNVHETQDTALWTSSPQVVKTVMPVFEHVWKGKK